MDIRTFDRVAVLLDRAVPWVARVERPSRLLTAGGAIAVAMLIGLVGSGAAPNSILEWIGFVLLCGLLLAPVVILLLFVITLRQIMSLPEQLRTLPQTTRDQGARLSEAIGKLRQPRQSGVRGSTRGLWNIRGALFELAGLAEPFLGLAGLVRLPFLILVVVAGALVFVEVVVAILAVLVIAAF